MRGHVNHRGLRFAAAGVHCNFPHRLAAVHRFRHYSLSDDEIKELNEGIVINNDRVDLNLSELSGPKKELAISLGRSFDTLSDEAVDELLNIISKE